MSKKVNPPKIQRFPPSKQRRMDELLEKNSEGRITPKEKLRLQALVAEAERLMVANSKRLAEFTKRQASPASAVPVTVWVHAEHAER
jgi:hypothetical protein